MHLKMKLIIRFHILNRLMFHFRTSFLPVLTSLIKNVSDIVSGYSLNRMSICDLIWVIAATISNWNHVQLVTYSPQQQCVYMNRNSSINTISFACPKFLSNGSSKKHTRNVSNCPNFINTNRTISWSYSNSNTPQ